jgi:hypothetical protein
MESIEQTFSGQADFRQTRTSQETAICWVPTGQPGHSSMTSNSDGVFARWFHR